MNEHPRPIAAPFWGGILVLLGTLLLAQSTGLVPETAASWVGTAVLAGIGLAFLVLYLAAPARWWAVIPAGTMLSLAAVTAVQPFVPGAVDGAIVLYGMAITFAAVALLPAARQARTWAWIPAALLVVLGTMTLGSVTPAAAAFWPLMLIIGGAYLVIAWTMRDRRGGGPA
jgi:hypothetical protein